MSVIVLIVRLKTGGFQKSKIILRIFKAVIPADSKEPFNAPLKYMTKTSSNIENKLNEANYMQINEVNDSSSNKNDEL